MAESVSVKPELLRWAIDRSRLPFDDLQRSFPKLGAWIRGECPPTFKQLEKFAKKTMTPFGYLFLDSPPDEKLPIPDFRTVGDSPIDRPSPNLIDTIHTMQRRQDWMREYVIDEGQDPLDFVGSAAISENKVALAARIRKTLGLDSDWAGLYGTWEDALTELRKSIEQIGVLVATSGVVGHSNHRGLDPQEFRGFVLCDEYAPLIFVNAADFKSAQMFTLAHELVHIWIGQGGLFNLIKTMPHDDASERFCNQVAAEFLVPEHEFRRFWKEARSDKQPFHTLARQFKVSPIVTARRAQELHLISKEAFFKFYRQDQEHWHAEKAAKKPGGNFYRTEGTRLGVPFAYAVIRAAREGRLLYRDAYKLTGLSGDTFSKFADRLMEKVRNERR